MTQRKGSAVAPRLPCWRVLQSLQQAQIGFLQASDSNPQHSSGPADSMNVDVLKRHFAISSVTRRSGVAYSKLV